ncbi:MAG TPA: NAD-dependent malic enzyme [Actinomycetota bacterium]
MSQISPSAGYSLRLLVNLRSTPGTLGRLMTAIGRAGGDLGAVDLIEHRGNIVVREITVKCRDDAHGRQIVKAAQRVQGVEVRGTSDRTFDIHVGGKISVTPKFPLRSRDDLSMAYTPGVGRVSSAIAENPELVYDYTIKANSVAVFTDGSAVLGLGDLGPEAAMPVMEGKAMLFKEFADIDAYPICIRADTADEIVAVAKAIAPGFGGINLEDIAAPECFEVEARLRTELDIPVFHDDQHGTAVVVAAALMNAARVAGRPLEDLKVVVLGMGAAGVACSKLMLRIGVGDLIGLDRHGVIHPGRGGLPAEKQWIADHTNRDKVTGDLEAALRGANVFVGLSGPNLVKPEWVEQMSNDAIVFAMANPVPEIMPEQMPRNVRVIGTGRSDYPNQINNVLVFPGFFRGLLDCRASSVTDTQKVAAAEALAAFVGETELDEEYILPSVFDRRVMPSIAAAVRDAAVAEGVARRKTG